APFRDAAGSRLIADRKSYQINAMNRREANRESLIDEQEGADMLMVKPAGDYLDIIRYVLERTLLPLEDYQISGEYETIQFAALAVALY
ncbi:porphobilinogen synthase, partial [Proteus mirabilis]|nr:porphobilinogen synthase [Proteus mirabilis]